MKGDTFTKFTKLLFHLVAVIKFVGQLKMKLFHENAEMYLEVFSYCRKIDKKDCMRESLFWTSCIIEQKGKSISYLGITCEHGL